MILRLFSTWFVGITSPADAWNPPSLHKLLGAVPKDQVWCVCQGEEFLSGCPIGVVRKLDVSENSGFSPQISHFNRVFHYFHHPFWGVSLFLETPNWWKKCGKIAVGSHGNNPNFLNMLPEFESCAMPPGASFEWRQPPRTGPERTRIFIQHVPRTFARMFTLLHISLATLFYVIWILVLISMKNQLHWDCLMNHCESVPFYFSFFSFRRKKTNQK